MTDIETKFIDVSRLKIGLFVHLDLGWMDHPFPLNSFLIRNQEQIDIIRSLDIEQVRYSPEKSESVPAPASTASAAPAPVPAPKEVEAETPEAAAARLRRDLLANQRASLHACERQFTQATQTYKHVLETVYAQPKISHDHAENLIKEFLGEILGEEEAAIRLLSEKAGDKTSLHAINVTIISLLLGKACGLSKPEMLDLGIGALLHDMGKMDLPDRLRWHDDQHTSAERQIYQEHVAHGVNLARKMDLSKDAMLIIAQHHEYADGTGYPNRIQAEKMSQLSKIISLVNRYDNLCNPSNPAIAITPHEALSQMFAQHKSQFHAPTMTLFVRMMGIYPPGSVVQLTDERYALVVSVNSARPIKPRVVIHDPHVPRDEALVINLETEPDLGIRRSLKPLQLPKAAYDYLSPRKRLCYFFERGREILNSGVSA